MWLPGVLGTLIFKSVPLLAIGYLGNPLGSAHAMSMAVFVDSLTAPVAPAETSTTATPTSAFKPRLRLANITAPRSVAGGAGKAPIIASLEPNAPPDRGNTELLASAQWETDGGRVRVDLTEVSGDVLARTAACRSRKTRGCA